MLDDVIKDFKYVQQETHTESVACALLVLADRINSQKFSEIFTHNLYELITSLNEQNIRIPIDLVGGVETRER